MSAPSTQDPLPAPPRSRGLAFWWATFFGSGLSPKMPGTVGSAASFVLWAPVVLFELPWWARLLLVVVVFVTGVPASTRAQQILQKEDPGAVVIDEVAGQGLALLLCGPHVASLVAGFALFRLFDIWKPWPVSAADRLHSGFGVMADDLVAGGYALVGLVLLERFAWPALGIL